MLKKAVEKSRVAPHARPRFEVADEDADHSNLDEGWVLNDRVAVARRLDVAQDKRRLS